MQKIGLIIALGAWIFVSIHYFTGQEKLKTDVVNTFCSTQVNAITGEIYAYGEYGITHFTEDEKRELLVKLASAIGAGGDYIFVDEDNTKTLIKNSTDVSLIIKVITDTASSDIIICDRQYISVDMKILNNSECIMTYKNMISDLFEADGIDGQVYLNLTGRIRGPLNYSERCEYTEKLLKMLDAKIITEKRGSELFTVYAYSDKIEEFIVSGTDKININISMDYDETTNETVVYLATPLNNLDY